MGFNLAFKGLKLIILWLSMGEMALTHVSPIGLRTDTSSTAKVIPLKLGTKFLNEVFYVRLHSLKITQDFGRTRIAAKISVRYLFPTPSPLNLVQIKANVSTAFISNQKFSVGTGKKKHKFCPYKNHRWKFENVHQGYRSVTL